MVDRIGERVVGPVRSTPVFTIFETAIGACGVAWTDAGILAVQLPEPTLDATLATLDRRCAAVPASVVPEAVSRAIADMVGLLAGAPLDLSAIGLDMSRVPPFHRRVYDVARSIPRGRTMTYGDVAMTMGAPGAARAVGQALGRNPFAIIVPCHRVVGAGGRSGGFSAPGGVSTKRRMLAIEGVPSSKF